MVLSQEEASRLEMCERQRLILRGEIPATHNDIRKAIKHALQCGSIACEAEANVAVEILRISAELGPQNTQQILDAVSQLQKDFSKVPPPARSECESAYEAIRGKIPEEEEITVAWGHILRCSRDHCVATAHAAKTLLARLAKALANKQG